MASWQALLAILGFWDLVPLTPGSQHHSSSSMFKGSASIFKNCVTQDAANRRDFSPMAGPVTAHEAVTRWTREARNQAASGMKAELQGCISAGWK